MRSLHPSDSAGDGQPILKARYSDPRDKPDHHRACAMCGFQFDDDVNQKGDSLFSPGIQYTAPVTATVNVPRAGVAFSDTTVEPSVVSGCPFCGTYNPEGRLIDREFGSNVDITNL